MPLSKHYGGSGEKVAASMKKEYGSDWERIFYATENARKKHKLDRAIRKKDKK